MTPESYVAITYFCALLLIVRFCDLEKIARSLHVTASYAAVIVWAFFFDKSLASDWLFHLFMLCLCVVWTVYLARFSKNFDAALISSLFPLFQFYSLLVPFMPSIDIATNHYQAAIMIINGLVVLSMFGDGNFIGDRLSRVLSGMAKAGHVYRKA